MAGGARTLRPLFAKTLSRCLPEPIRFVCAQAVCVRPNPKSAGRSRESFR